MKVEDQSYATVSENGAAGDPLNIFEDFPKALDDHFLLAQQIVHEKTELLAFRFGDDKKTIADLFAARLYSESLIEAHHRQQTVTHQSHFAAALHGGDYVRCGTNHFSHVEDGKNVAMISHRDHQAVDDRERKGQT